MRPTDPKPSDPVGRDSEAEQSHGSADEPPPTVVERPPAFLLSSVSLTSSPSPSFDDAVIDPETTVGGVESRILLARARRSLLGWDEAPVQVGRYRILERIGTGGMGVIYSAQDDELDRQVAIKILRHDLAPGTTGRQRLLREAQATAKLSHPNVVHVYEVGQEGDQVFMAMELVRGDTLRVWRDAETRTWQDIVEMYSRAGEGLAAAHAEGIVHRDFKPDNVIVGRDGRPRVLDFGLARATTETLSSSDALPIASTSMTAGSSTTGASRSSSALRDLDLTRTGTVVGTPAYMAPEQLERGEPDARSDQFSFCVALFEALHGRRPFAGTTYTELGENIRKGAVLPVDPRTHGIPRALQAVVLTGLARDPALRHRDMRTLLEALRLAGKPARSGRMRAIAGALGLGAVAAGAIVLSTSGGPQPAEAPTPTPEPTPAPVDAWARIVAESDLPPEIPEPLPGDPTGMTVHRLRNGMTVYVVPRPLEPFVNASLVLRAGATQEGQADQGLSALTLAAVMEGGDRLGVRDLARERPLRAASVAMLEALPSVGDERGREALLRAAGAAEVATTGAALRDEYYAGAVGLGGRDPLTLSGPGSIISLEIPTHRFAAWLELSAEMLRRPNFRNFLTVSAQKLESLARIAEGHVASQAATQALVPATGIHEDFAAAAARVAEIPLADTRRFWSTYYRPNNTALILIGDITAAEALPMIERSFGDWEPAPIPRAVTIDAPLAQARTQVDVNDTGSPLALLVWPLPPVASPEFATFVELSRVLSGADGILAGALRESTSGGSSDVGPHRDLTIAVYPGPEQSLADAETQMYGVLEDVAADRIPDTIWERALAQAELERHRWARTNGALTRLVVESYLGRTRWQDVGASLGPTPVDRKRVVATAGTLLRRGYVAVHRSPGKPPTFPSGRVPPIERTPPQLGVHSEFVRALIDAPSIPMEPRFLVEGSAYRVHPRGAGRVITTQSQEPIVRLGWIHRVGAAEDPFVCDAVRALADRIPVAGFEATVTCGAGETRIDLVATTAAFERDLPAVVAWLGGGELTLAEAELYAEQAVQWRREARSDSWNRAAALHIWALRGDHLLDTMMADDDTMRSEGPRAMVASLRALAQIDPDIVFVGAAPQRLLDALPPPRGVAGPAAPVRAWRELDEPTVFVLDDPDREDVSVRVAVPWFAADPKSQLAATMHLAATQNAAWETSPTLDTEQPLYNAKWSANTPIGIGVGLRAAPVDVAEALGTAMTMLRSRPDADHFAVARDRLEVAFRAWRVPPREVPDRVRQWTGDDDPRVAQWLALPSLAFADVERYYAELDRRIPAVSIVGDVRGMDLDRLRAYGRVVHVRIDDILRDPMMAEIGDDTPSMLAE